MLRFSFVIVALAVSTASWANSAQAKLSPFQMVRWAGETPEVQLDDRWYGVVSISGVTTEDLLEHCRTQHGRRWAKRFCEDLVQVLGELGRAPTGDTVDLVLRDLKSGEQLELDDVRMTAVNRERIRRAEPRPGASGGGGAASAPGPVERVKRKHSKGSKRFEFLAKRYYEDGAGGETISAEDAAADLDQLEWHLTHEFSYATRLGFDYPRALDTVRAGLGDGIQQHDFHIQLRKLVAQFGDGHARVRGAMRVLPSGFLPVRIVDLGGRLGVLDADDDRYVRSDAKTLAAIDGVEVDRWLAAAARLAPQGSRQLIRADAIRWLNWVNYLRQDLGLPVTPKVELTLESDDEERTTVVMEVASRPHFFEPHRDPTARKIRGNIGVFGLPDMRPSGDELKQYHDAMIELRDTKGLIIDVRGNSGGRRDILKALLPYFLPKDAPPFIANVAAYRMAPGTPPSSEGYLANRGLYPAEAKRWTAKEQRAIRKFARRFRPSWKLPKTGFSDWHYFIVRREGPPTLYHYDKPVVVLMDQDCFSATDIFLGAFAELPDVTLLGSPSGGGSGRSNSVTLAKSGLQVRLSTMASYRPNGQIYEGQGVEPDVVRPRAMTDVLGATDTVLEAARQRLSGK